tara:strand:+ start:190 stop:459 length:270 start_codon:yes stop_codon:yes gene_type:complete
MNLSIDSISQTDVSELALQQALTALVIPSPKDHNKLALQICLNDKMMWLQKAFENEIREFTSANAVVNCSTKLGVKTVVFDQEYLQRIA